MSRLVCGHATIFTMHVRALFFAQAAVLALVTALFIVGLMYYLQWRFWWYDLVLHGLGGIWVALAVMWLLTLVHRAPRIATVIISVIIVGALWEIFEFAIGAPREVNYQLDTTTDLLMDAVGAVAGFIVGYRLTPRISERVIQ